MKFRIYQVDAFTDHLFSGNPAAVVLVDEWLDNDLMQLIAVENNLTTTAFMIDREDNPSLRYFTPTIEEDICGHATMASAWLVFNILRPAAQMVNFDTCSGTVPVRLRGDKRLEIDFPVRLPRPVVPDPRLLEALGSPQPLEILAGRDYLLVFDDEARLREIRPDYEKLLKIDRPAVIVTAPGAGDFDCVSRFFAPAHGINEDSATGAAHATVAPYWAEKLGKPVIHAYQASARGGVFECAMRRDRVTFVGQCVLYMEGLIHIGSRGERSPVASCL